MAKSCLCKSVQSTIILCRLFGLCPITWKHVDSICFYRRSIFWMIYSLICFILLIYYLIITLPTKCEHTTFNSKIMLEYISAVNHNISTIFIASMIFFNVVKAQKIAQVFNSCSELKRNDLICKVTLKVHKVFHIGVLMLFSGLYLMQYAAIIILNIMDSFDTNWSSKRLLQPFLHNTPLLFGFFVATICVIIQGMLTCYEKVMMINLNFIPVHPAPNFDETCEHRSLFFFYKYERCKDCHKVQLPYLDQLDKVHALKKLHEKIMDCVSVVNSAFSPQLVIFMALEILALVVHWYLVILYFTIKEKSPEQSTINFFNWLFVLVQTWSLFLFLKQADLMESYVSIFSKNKQGRI